MSNNNGYNGNGLKPPEEGGDDNVVRLPSAAERARAAAAARRSAHPREPLINLPPVTKGLIAIFLLIHVVTNYAIDDVQRYWVFEHFGLVTGAYTGNSPLPLWSMLCGPFTYMFLHGNWMHIIMNGAMMMAFGAGVERWMGGKRLFALFFLCALVSALVQFACAPESTNPVIGASGGLSGLFAAVLLMLQQRGIGPTGRFGIWPFVLVWVAISALFGFLGAPDGSAIAWPAHIGGFLAGFVLLKPVMKIP